MFQSFVPERLVNAPLPWPRQTGATRIWILMLESADRIFCATRLPDASLNPITLDRLYWKRVTLAVRATSAEARWVKRCRDRGLLLRLMLSSRAINDSMPQVDCSYSSTRSRVGTRVVHPNPTFGSCFARPWKQARGKSPL